MSEAPSDEQLRRALQDDEAAKPAKTAKPKRPKRPRRKGKLKPEVVRVDESEPDESEPDEGEPDAHEDAPDTEPAPEAAPPEPAPPTEPKLDEDAEMRAQEMDELRRQLADMRDQMEAMSAAKDQIEGVAEKFTGMEDRMGNLLQLSELLSIQYNPFLEDAEDQVFEGRHDADELIQSLREKKRDRRPGSEVVRPDRDEPVPLESPAEESEAPPDASPDVARRPAPETSPQPKPAPTYAPPPMPTFVPAAHAPVAPVGRSREAYLALCWLEHLAETAPDGATHLLLDHYRRLGWVGEDDYTWLSVLAHSVSVPTEVAWSDFQLTGPEMARFHRENMTFLDRLFHHGFEERDPGRWQDQARRWLEGQ